MRTLALAVCSAALLYLAPASIGIAQNSAPLVPPAERSAHFAAVNKHLELGGVYYGYVDIDGDVDLLGQNLSDLAARLATVQPQLAMFKQDFGPLLGMLGLTDVKAIGFSSVAVGQTYRNRTFVYTPQGRHGLLTAFGGAPHAFSDAHYAPADADVFAESDVDLPSAYAALRQVVAKVGGDAMVKPLETALQTKTSAGIVPFDIIQHFTGHVVVVGRLDVNQPITLPNTPDVQVPGVSFFIRIDGVGKSVEPALAGIPVLKKGSEGSATIYEMGEAVAGSSLQPLVAIEGESLILASNRAFFNECLSRKTGLDQQPDFKAALVAVGPVGNGVTYLTPRLMDGLRKAVTDAAAKNPQVQPIIESWLNKIPKIDRPLVSVRSNEADGILFRSSWNRSLKQDTAMVLAANPVTIGLLAAMAIPAFEKVRMSSQDTAIKNNLRQFEAAGQQFLMETGKKSATYADLVGPDKYIKALKSVAGEDYTKLIVHPEDNGLTIRKANGQVVSTKR